MLTKDFIEKFMALKNRNADIKIEHCLYGNQKINRCVLHPFIDEGRIGLVIEDEERYITMDELCEISISDLGCNIKSKVMDLYIML